MAKRSATASLIRRLNRSAILDLIREHSPISRSEIARQLNISMPTVMRVVDKLFAEDLVRWSGNFEVTGGRPRYLLEFNAHGYAVLGLDLGGTRLYGTLADLGGNVHAERSQPWRSAQSEATVEQVCDFIAELLAQPLPPDQQLRGIGVGAPGVTLFEQGIVTWAPSLGWRNLPLKDILSERFDLPVVVENDVNLAALGEYGFGAARGASSAVCMNVGTGIGAGIIIERKIFRGYNQSAGEVGYLPPGISVLGSSNAGFGALESLASGTAIERRARALLQSQDLAHSIDPPSIEAVFEAAQDGQAWAKQIVMETADHLALAIAAISAILDPEIIVLGGSLTPQAGLLIEPITSRIQGLLPVPLNLVQSTLGLRAAVLGAIMLVLDTTTEHVMVNEVS